MTFLLSPLGRWLAGGALFIAVLGGVWLHGDNHGASRVQRKWDAAVAAAIERGEKARADAVRDIDSNGNGVVPNDQFDRD